MAGPLFWILSRWIPKDFTKYSMCIRVSVRLIEMIVSTVLRLPKRASFVSLVFMYNMHVFLLSWTVIKKRLKKD